MLEGRELVSFAQNRVGTPYFYGSKLQYGKLTEEFMQKMHKGYPGIVTTAYMNKARKKKNVGQVNVDCSGLIAGYTLKMLGSYQLYSAAKARLDPNDYKDFADGVVMWRSGHVGIFAHEGDEYVVYEAKGIDYGTVRSKYDPKKWTKGLTFSWMEYFYKKKVKHTVKEKNPYPVPKTKLENGSRGSDVKWLQFELNEAGFDLKIDGEFGAHTFRAVTAFQKSSKITVDGIVGQQTRKALLLN